MTEQTNNPTIELASTTVAENAPVVESKGFKDLLAEDLKENKSLTNFKDVNDLAKSYIHLNTLLGKKINDWSSEDAKAFTSKVYNKPENIDGYVLPEELGDSAKELKDLAFSANLSQEQAKALADKIIVSGREKAELSKSEADNKRKAAEEALRKEFGGAYEKRLELANKAILQVGGEEFVRAINNAGLGTNTDLLRGFMKLGKDYFDTDKIVLSDKSGMFGITPDEAKKQKAALLADRENLDALVNVRHPKHGYIRAEVNRLSEIMDS